MNKIDNIVFMGTPDFAVPVLESLHINNYNIASVVTQPDRPKGRGRQIMPPPVKETALKLGYNVTQPEFIKNNNEFINELINIKPDLFVVVAYGHILPEKVLKIPRLGAINIHASLLPKYRGSAPIQWAIINGEKETGITTMFMDKGMDTGDILLMSKTKIKKYDTSQTLHDRLADIGANLLIDTLKELESGNLKPIKQDHDKATYAPLLKKKNGHINWQKPALEIDSFIRGMTPWPGAFTFYEKKRFKIFKANCIDTKTLEMPGTVIQGFSDELLITTGSGIISILELQTDSGKRMDIKQFLRGYQIEPGTVFS